MSESDQARNTLQRIRVFLSSPSDVQPERERCEAIVRAVNAELEGLDLEVARWEDGVYRASSTFQDQIDRPGDCDLVVCLFWRRLGTPLPEHYSRPDGTPRSGTEYEFEQALESASERDDGLPDIFVYRKTAPVEVDLSDERLEREQTERRALEAFWQRWFRDEEGHFLAAFHTFENTDSFARHFERHLRGWLSEQRQSDWDIAQQGSPFRGLQAFDESHAAVFFGRRRLVERARARLMAGAQEGMGSLFVLGASGSGKSSLVRAGLVPRLRVPDATAPFVARWRRVVVTPADLKNAVTDNLARRLYAEDVLPELADGDYTEPQALSRLLGRSPEDGLFPLVRALHRWGELLAAEEGHTEPPRTGLLVVVDQLEEVFQLDPEEQQALVDLLSMLAAHERFWLVTTLRSDFYAALQAHPGLLHLKEQSQALDVGPPTAADMRSIIEGAARAAGLRLEDDGRRSLAEELERESAEPGALPMVQFALQSLFERRDRETGLMRLADYDELGGAAGALARRADAVLDELGDSGQGALAGMLRRLVDVRVDEPHQGVQARTAARDDFPPGTPQRELVDRLLEARLLIAFAENDDDSPRIRVAHESLFERWPQAARQIANDRRDLETRARLEQAEILWQTAAHNQKKQRLLSGLPLEEGRDLAKRWGQELPSSLRQYIHASEAAAAARQRRTRATVAGVMAFFIALASVAGWQWQVAEEREREAIAAKEAEEAARREAEDEREKAEQIAEFQASMFQDVDPELMGVHHREEVLAEARRARERLGYDEAAIEREMAELEDLLAGTNFTNAAVTALSRNVFDPAIEAIEREFDDQPLVEARLLQTVAHTLREMGLYDRAGPAQESALDIRRRVLGDDHPDTLTSLNNMGALLVAQGKPAEAEPYYREALEGNRSVLGDDHPGTLVSINNMGFLLQAQGKLAEAEPYYREAQETRRRVLGDDHSHTLTSVHNMGFLLQRQGKLAEAEPYYREALEGFRRVLGEEHPDTLTSLNNMGDLLREQGKPAEAEPYYREALEGFRRVLGEEHPDTLTSLNNMGFLLQRQGKLAEAEPYYCEALESRRRVLGDEHPHTLISINNMGSLQRDLGELEEAEQLGVEAIEAASRILPEGHWHIGVFLSHYARTLAAMERFEEAEEHMLEAHAILEVADHPRKVEVTEYLGDLYDAWHEHEPDYDAEAEKWRAELAALSDSNGESSADK